MTTQTTETQPTTYEVSSQSRNLATLSHLSAFITFFGIPSLVGPLVLWLLNRDDPYVEQQAKEALNFNISFLIYGVAAALSIIFLVGLVALPVVLVTWFGAKAYCEFYDNRLPLEFEWEKAARGTDGRAYPWGDEIARNNANFYSSHDLFEKIVGGLGDTTPVGFYNGQAYEGYQTLDSPSPYSLYDMAGNVWQWSGDIYDDTHLRYMRGGSKENYEYNLRTWTRNNAGPEYFSPNVGFRCVRGATP